MSDSSIWVLPIGVIRLSTAALCFCLAGIPAYTALATAQPATIPATANVDKKQPIPFPSGYDFPADPAKLYAEIKQRNTAALRQHGWYLWAGVNQPGRDGWPIWRSWNIATQVFAPAAPPLGAAKTTTAEKSTAPPTPTPTATACSSDSTQATAMKAINRKNNPSINVAIPFYLIPEKVRAKHAATLKGIVCASKIPDGDNFQNNGDLMLVSEPYSQPAVEGIRKLKLYEAATLNALQAAGKTDIPPLDARTVVLKHMYWPVKKTGLTALPIANMPAYRQPAVPNSTYVGFENIARWKEAVAIDPTRVKIPPNETAKVTYLFDVRQSDQTTPLGPHTYAAARVVPLANFYFKKLSLTEYDALSAFDRVLIDASFYWVQRV